MRHAEPLRSPEPLDPAEEPLPLAGEDMPRPVHRPQAPPRPVAGEPRPVVGEPRPVHRDARPADDGQPKIRQFGARLGGEGRHEDEWDRTPNTTGTGAIHVKSFHAKLTGESLEFLDRQINEWLDSHPQYEVKFVSTCVGEWTGKIKEPNLIVQVWV